MSDKALEIGDTVIIRGVITGINPTIGMVKIKTNDDCPASILFVSASRISEIIPKPWEPKVGELARYCSAPNNGTVPATILAIAEGYAMLRFNNASVGTVRVSSLSSPVPSAV